MSTAVNLFGNVSNIIASAAVFSGYLPACLLAFRAIEILYICITFALSS